MTLNTPPRTGRHVAAYHYAPPVTRRPRPIEITRDLQLELARFNAGVERARREAMWHPASTNPNACPPNHKCPNRIGDAAEKQARYRGKAAS